MSALHQVSHGHERCVFGNSSLSCIIAAMLHCWTPVLVFLMQLCSAQLGSCRSIAGPEQVHQDLKNLQSGF